MKHQNQISGYMHLTITILLLNITFSTFAKSLNDSATFFDYIIVKGVAYDVKLVKTASFFNLSLQGPKLYVHIDSLGVAKGGRPQVIVDSFASVLTESSSRQLPMDFSEEQYISRTVSGLMGQMVTNASSAHLSTVLREDGTLQQELKLSYQRIKSNFLMSVAEKNRELVQQKKDEEIKALNQGHKRTIDSLLNVIDQVDEENKYAGQLEFLDTAGVGIPVYTTKGATKIDTQQVRFIAKKIMVRTFNNFIDMLHVDGVLSANGKRYEVRCYNPEYSIPLKHIYMRNQFVVFSIEDSIGEVSTRLRRQNIWRYMLNVSDLIQLNTYNNHFTFMIKNDAYVLTRKDSIVPFYRRSFYDYLNFTTFLDFLGVMEKTPNSLIQLEGRVRLPVQLTNSRLGKRSFNNVFFPKIDVYLNAAFVNGSQQDNRFGTIFNQASTSIDMDSLFIDHFDLIRKYNIHSGLEIGLFKKERKAKNINTYIDYSVRFFRSSLRYTIIDSTELDQQEQFNAWSLTHGPVLRFEYRPDLNLGADFSFAADFRQRILNSDNDNLQVFEIKGPLNRNLNSEPSVKTLTNPQRTNFKIEFNVYYMVNPRRSNGGLFFRTSNYFTYNFKQIFPQLMVGYSTRLTGMINNLTDRASSQ